ncbi:MAG: DUF1349 domain-containing protein [Chloroflexota bacterium]
MIDHPLATVPGLPQPLRQVGGAGEWRVTADRALTLEAGGRTDWFIDPDSGSITRNAPALVMPTEGSWMLSALVSADHRATFDAAVLVVHVSDNVWAKLCLELSPEGEVTVVSVVTQGFSDDCNSVPVHGAPTHLRISRLEHAFAFHYSTDGTHWNLVRYFSLGVDQGIDVGFLAQSPTGNGCTADFQVIEFVPDKLMHIRSGA